MQKSAKLLGLTTDQAHDRLFNDLGSWVASEDFSKVSIDVRQGLVNRLSCSDPLFIPSFDPETSCKF